MQHFARGGDQRSPKAAHGGALPALASRNDSARIVSFARNSSVHRRTFASRNHSRGAAHDGATTLPASAVRRSTNRAAVRDTTRTFPATMRGQRTWLSHAHVRAAGWRGRRRKRRWRGRNFDSDFVSILKNKMLDTIQAIHIDQIGETLALIPLLGIRIRPPARQRKNIKQIAVDYRQSGQRPDPRLLRQAALEALTRSARTNTPRKTRPERFPAKLAAATAAHGGGGVREGGRGGWF
ncbi:hypothetical protein F511_40912 [Dorcoceras hygrometricum]|uniref:Uncharacterized protein n=1 Tax=Dorcoceras hygrometricum TaxID=472368 RepID=A0A2Z7DFL6_9LAMI|nr:hypothetical protein F511_40912 [Dorcoceras hygrometricum]